MPGISGGSQQIVHEDLVFIEAQLQKGFSTISVSEAFPIGPSSIRVLNQNASRKYIHLINIGGNPIWVQYGAAAIVGRGIRLNPGAIWTTSGWDLFLGQIYAVSATDAPSQLEVLEGQ